MHVFQYEPELFIKIVLPPGILESIVLKEGPDIIQSSLAICDNKWLPYHCIQHILQVNKTNESIGRILKNKVV